MRSVHRACENSASARSLAAAPNAAVRVASCCERARDGRAGASARPSTIAVAASVWRPLAASQDELAERSIRYLTALQDERERS